MAELICGEVETACVCISAPEHDGPHVCDCGGSWTWDGDKFIVVTYPEGRNADEAMDAFVGLLFGGI